MNQRTLIRSGAASIVKWAAMPPESPCDAYYAIRPDPDGPTGFQRRVFRTYTEALAFIEPDTDQCPLAIYQEES